MRIWGVSNNSHGKRLGQLLNTKYSKSSLSTLQIQLVSPKYIQNNFFGIDVEPDFSWQEFLKVYLPILGDGRSGKVLILLKPTSDWETNMRQKIKLKCTSTFY